MCISTQNMVREVIGSYIRKYTKKVHNPIMSIKRDKKKYGYVSKAIAFFAKYKAMRTLLHMYNKANNE